MEEEESTVGKNKLASIPANYVSLVQLQERWIKEKEREKNEQEQLHKEKERQEQLHKEKERQEHEKNEQGRLQKQKHQQQEKSDKEFRKREPPKERINRKREAHQGKEEQRPEAVMSVTTAEVGENGTNSGSLKAKRKILDPWKKKENLWGVDKEHIAVGTQEPSATSTVREDRRRPQRMNEGPSKDSTLGVEGSFSRLSFNHSDRRHKDGYMKYSSSFKGGNYSRQFAGNGRVWDTDRAPVSMMWVKKGSVGDTDGDACETRSLNKGVNCSKP